MLKTERLTRKGMTLPAQQTRTMRKLSFAMTCLRLWLFVLTFALVEESFSEVKQVQFNRDVRPILSNHCFACHGPDEKQRKAKLRLDLKESLFEKRKNVLVAIGKPGASELFLRLSHSDPEERMPPEDFPKQLKMSQVNTIKAWIEQGAPWEDHWSYTPPRMPSLTEKKKNLSPIDHFILKRLNKSELSPALPTDSRTLVRRLHLDLIGLPPAPSVVEAFATNPSHQAFTKLVDKLLGSPHFGERLALPWLDLARYADSVGYQKDRLRDCWLYRDYLIRAFNENKPYDQFVIEQLAGDLLEGDPLEKRSWLIASGLNRMNQTTSEGGAQSKEYVAKYAADRVRNTAAIFLGSTMGCAECHDHKYDPFTTKDFYAFAAFFADIKERGVGYPEHTAMPTYAHLDEWADLQNQMTALQVQVKDIVLADEKKVLDEKINAIKDRIAKVADPKKWPKTLVSLRSTPRTVRMLPRGNWLDESGPIMSPAVPTFLGKLDIGKRRATRLDLARWIVSRENPLTARVFVNRIWKQFFGKGLARDLDDLGAQGERPTHPKLLDWLAVEFMENNWDIKRLIRQIVTSEAYRRSSNHPASTKLDPENRLLARQGAFRLEAELIRDNALAISGLLVPKIGGRSVKPYQPSNYWYRLYNSGKYVQDKGEELYRRGIYTLWRRSFWHPSLQAFDAPAREECVAERPISNTPQQALVLLNDPTYVESARLFAERILASHTQDFTRFELAFRFALARSPNNEERLILQKLLAKERSVYSENTKAALALINTGEKPHNKTIDPAELAAWTSVARAILNLHETITRN
jgi:hypothetical protein